jgi:hypothetical protein
VNTIQESGNTLPLWFVSRAAALDRMADDKKLKNCCVHKHPIARRWIDVSAFVAAICLLTFVGFNARSLERVPEPAGYRLN